MIIFLDQNKKIATLYTKKGSTDIPFNNIEKLSQIKENILYVTSAQYVSSKSIISLVKQNTTAVEQKVVIPQTTQSSIKYIHSMHKGVLIITDIQKSFSGKYDIKLLDNTVKQDIKRSVMMQSYIKQGILKIIDSNEKDRLLIENKNMQKEKQNKIDKDTKDREMGFNGSAEEAAASMFDNNSSEGVIDLGGTPSGSGPQTMSELINLMDNA